MADDKLKQELLYMASLTSKYDFTKMEVVESILRLENERRILDSVFGGRFKTRIFDIAAGVSVDDKCVLCGAVAENHVICNHCMETILGSDYAKGKIKSKTRKKLEISLKLNDVLKYAAVVCLVIILVIQIWLLSLLRTIPNSNPAVEAQVSTNEQVAVTDVDAAMAQLMLDFPKEQGYEIIYARKDSDYVGRFLLERGDCCAEIEEQLTDEERYDYFFKEPVYIFYISNIEEYSARVGMAEVNEAGAILVMGSFNDGRRTDSFYKYR